jgi:hypothetical protein
MRRARRGKAVAEALRKATPGIPEAQLQFIVGYLKIVAQSEECGGLGPLVGPRVKTAERVLHKPNEKTCGEPA